MGASRSKPKRATRSDGIVKGMFFRDGLHLIFSYLTDDEWYHAQCTCRYWNSVAATEPCRQMQRCIRIFDTNVQCWQSQMLQRHLTSITDQEGSWLRFFSIPDVLLPRITRVCLLGETPFSSWRTFSPLFQEIFPNVQQLESHVSVDLIQYLGHISTLTHISLVGVEFDGTPPATGADTVWTHVSKRPLRSLEVTFASMPPRPAWEDVLRPLVHSQQLAHLSLILPPSAFGFQFAIQSLASPHCLPQLQQLTIKQIGEWSSMQFSWNLGDQQGVIKAHVHATRQERQPPTTVCLYPFGRSVCQLR